MQQSQCRPLASQTAAFAASVVVMHPRCVSIACDPASKASCTSGLARAGVFSKLDDLHPIVSTQANFDDVLVPADHISRSSNDTYYVSKDTVLRVC